MEKMDYKKAFKDLYQPKNIPMLIDVPEMKFIRVEGKGDPNDPSGEYQSAVELLYALSFGIKMSPKKGEAPDGYFEYTVPPLEGFWEMPGKAGIDYSDKSKFRWISVIRQPEFVTDEVFEKAVKEVKRKKPHLDTDRASLISFKEGLCIQVMHIGPFETEPATVEKMAVFAAENGFSPDFSDKRMHHEIYLSDPRKAAKEKMKTVIRHPVK